MIFFGIFRIILVTIFFDCNKNKGLIIKKQILLIIGLSMLGSAGDFYYENGKKIEVVKIQKKRSSNSTIEYYKSEKGHVVGVENDLLVECEEKVNCREVLTAYETISVSNLTDTIYLIRISKDKNIFKFAENLYNNKKIKIAHPNFRKEKRRR